MDEIQCEAALDWRGWGTVPIRSADLITSQPTRLPAELVTACALLERRGFGGDLLVDCTDEVARRLTDAMWIRVRELAASGQIPWSLPNDVAELGRALSPFAVSQIVKRVVYDGLEYDPVVEGLERRPLLVRASYHVRRLAYAFTKNAISFAEAAAHRRRPRVLCGEFALAMSALFYALKRATGAPANAYVPMIRGRALGMEDDVGHAWNWIVDAERGTINALDATGSGDVALEQYRNVSAFLASTCDLVSNGFDLATFLCATIDPESDAGQMRLFHFAEHFTVPPELRARIAVHLEASGFRGLVPDWHDRLAHVDASLRRFERFAFSQAADALPPLEPLRLRCRPISTTVEWPLVSGQPPASRK